MEGEKFSAFSATDRDGQDEQDALSPKSPEISGESIYNGQNGPPILQNMESSKFSDSKQEGKRGNDGRMGGSGKRGGACGARVHALRAQPTVAGSMPRGIRSFGQEFVCLQ